VTNEVYEICADLVLNAAGPWAGKVAALAGIDIPLSLSPGIHVILGERLTHLAINRMRMPGSGDWLAPVRNHSVIGTSSWSVADGDYIYPREDHIQQMRDEVGAMVPLAKTLPAIAINAAARPLLAASGKSERELSRTFECFDHVVRDQVEGFVTVTGGKLCTARAMGEFGAVSVVSGHIRGVTNTMPLHIEVLYNEYNFVAAFAVASLLALLSLITIGGKTLFERRVLKTSGAAVQVPVPGKEVG
jgi:ABC-type sulfate transport system permease subunit